MKAWLVFALAALSAYAQDDLARGKKLYEGHCALCHGITGTGGKGPSLAQPVLRRAPDVERLAEVIKQGIPGTEMPGAWQLTDREAALTAGYVLSMGRTAVVKLPGDAERGRTLYESKGGCAACHIVRGAGAGVGPELTDIGARRNAEYLREALVAPGAVVPENFLVVNVTTRAGKSMRGIRVNEDTFTIQLRDSGGHLHSFLKSELAIFRKEFNTSLMPSYDKTFTAAELDDVIAYLATLRGDS